MGENNKWGSLDTNDPLPRNFDGSYEDDRDRIQSRAKNSDGRRSDSEVLRTGHSGVTEEINYRGGRMGSSSEERVRSEEDGETTSSGMVSHEILELRSPEEYRRVCEENTLGDGQTVEVFSLTTESGNYFADNNLVKNCHRIKDASSKVSRALKGATGDAPFRFGLSGTPIASTPADLFSVLNWLMPEAYPSKKDFLDRFCDTAFNEWGAREVFGIKEKMKKEFFNGLDPFFRRVSKEAVLDFLPPLLRERRDVFMNPKQKKAYNQMRDNMVAELEDGDVVVTTSPLTKMTRLLQFASAYAEIHTEPVFDDELGEVVDKPIVKLSDPSCKISAFMEDMEDFGDNSVVVFAASKQLINMLSQKLEKDGIAHGLITGDQDAVTRKAHMEDFQAGRTKYILCTMAAGGTGITLTKGSIMVFLQRSWSMIDNLQSEARAYRIGSQQHESVKIIDYVTKDTAEEAVIQAVENKTDQLQEVLRDKELMAKVLRNEKIENGAPIDTSTLSE